MAITGILSVLSTLQYNNLIIIVPKNEENLSVELNRTLNLFSSFIIAILSFLSFYLFPNFLRADEFDLIFFTIPFSVFLSGQNQVYRTFANRKKEYNHIVVNTVVVSLLTPLLSIFFGYIIDGPWGLFISLIVGQLVGYSYLYINLKRKYTLSLTFNFKKLFTFAKKHKEFPQFILGTEFLGTYVRKLPVLLLSKFFGLEIVGIYNLAVRMLSLPSQFIGNSVSEVFRQKISEISDSEKEMKKTYKDTFLLLFSLVIIPFITIQLFGPELFDFFFGDNWKKSGEISKILVWQFSLQMIISPLSFMFILKKKMKETFYCHIYLVLSSLAIFYLFKSNLNMILSTYVLNYCLIYLYYLRRSYSFTSHV